MITIEETALAEEAALLLIAGAHEADDAFNWRQFYLEKFEAFTSCARTWRQIAHTAQLAGEPDVVMQAVTNALENEMFAKEAAFKAKCY